MKLHGLMWLMFLPGVALSAGIYRCETPEGPPAFQQVPCAGSGEQVELSAPAARWTPLRPGERAMLSEAERRQGKPARRKSAERGNQASERTCWEKRRRLEAVSAKLRRGYKPAQGERLRRRRDDLNDFLFRYCD